MRVWMQLLSTLIISMLHSCTATPVCENPTHPLPTLSSCLHLIRTIHKEAQTYPFLYEWSHHPSGFNEMQLPRTWVDNSALYTTTRCAVTVDTVKGDEDDRDSFTFRDIAIVAQRIVNECLLQERGIRPQVGSDLIGFFNKPKTVRVYLRSVRFHRPGVVNMEARNRTDDAVG